ncbi:MAG: hypothetical protein E7575_05630 [Ruminococcaceae bacterium]|nr:hypothetical protein [Oscillospiraceae bacterium]
MRSVKRFFFVLLAVILAFSMVSCSDKSDSSKEKAGDHIASGYEGIVGKWMYSQNSEYVQNLVTDIINDPNVYVKLYYEFYADGTGKTYMSTDDYVQEFTYTYDGETLTITGKDGTFDTPAKLKGDILSVYEEFSGEYLDMKRQ